MKKLVASLSMLGALLAACTSSTSSSSGASSSGDGGTSSGGASGSSCSEYTACSLISATAVGQAFGTTFSAGSELDENKTPSATEAEEVQCNFTGTGGWNVSILVRCCPCGDNEPESVESEDQSLDQTTTSVAGVGDSAFWAAPGADAGLLSNAYSLNAFVGADLYVMVNVLTPAGAPAPLAGATTVTQTVLGAL